MATESFYSLQTISQIETNIYCQLLEIDSYKVILNLGSDVSLDLSYSEELEKILSSVDCILISHAEIKYFGGLLRIHKKYKGKIIMTLPIYTFSKIIFEEILQNMEIADIKKFTAEDLDSLYSSITIVKYSQPLEIGSLRFSAKNSGHTLGGTLWQIQKDNDIITVALDINHKKENHIDGCNLSNMKKSFLFLTNCDFVGEIPSSRKSKEKEFQDILNDVPTGKVFFICNLMRSLEICCILNEHFEKNRLTKKCAFISFQSKKTHETLKGFLEWTGDMALKKFTTEKTNPFKFDNIAFIDLFNEIPKKTKIFIIPDDGSNSVFKNRLIFDNNKKENHVVFFDDNSEEYFLQSKAIQVPFFIMPDKINENYKETSDIFTVSQNSSNIEESVSLINKVEDSKNDDRKKLVFPLRNQAKPKDLYGEFFDRSIIRSQEEDKEIEVVENELIEEKKEIITVSHQKFEAKTATSVMNFNGLIDGNAMKDILESVEIEKMILFGKDKVFVDFFRDICVFTKCIKEIVTLENQKVNLSSDTSICKVDLEEEFLEDVNLKQFKNIQISPFVGEIKENLLSFKRPLTKQFSFGQLDFRKLASQLLEKNFRVRKLGNKGLLIDDCVEILQTDSKVLISADYTGKFIFIRNIIYQNMIFIE